MNIAEVDQEGNREEEEKEDQVAKEAVWNFKILIIGEYKKHRNTLKNELRCFRFEVYHNHYNVYLKVIP